MKHYFAPKIFILDSNVTVPQTGAGVIDGNIIGAGTIYYFGDFTYEYVTNEEDYNNFFTGQWSGAGFYNVDTGEFVSTTPGEGWELAED